jgi:1-acyl-sn-glycerol-3-phosphate acyltransferase
MGFRRAAVTCFLKTLLTILCKIDCREYYKVLTKNEPMLVVFNHVNFLEVPILVTHSYPVCVSGLVKSETWNNPVFAFIFNSYKAVPIDRRGAFSDSFKKAQQLIKEGFFMCIAPEGTRSKDGVLGKGKAGIVQLALEADLPILPVAHHGGENIWQNIKKFKRTPFCFRAGKPFRIKYDGRPGKEEREIIISEIMGRIACLLPEDKRGMYSQQALEECKYLEFI